MLHYREHAGVQVEHVGVLSMAVALLAGGWSLRNCSVYAGTILPTA